MLKQDDERGSTLPQSLEQITIDDLLARAKEAIVSGERSMQAAAEAIACAREQGATQREIAQAVGKSAGWVNRLLQWRKCGYLDDTAFGAQARASRQRRVQATEREKPTTTTDHAQAAAEDAPAEPVKGEAQAAEAKADDPTAREKAKADAYDYFEGAIGADAEKDALHSGTRELLIKALGMLGSNQAGERANAALFVEKQRAKLGMTWNELIIPANEAEAPAA